MEDANAGLAPARLLLVEDNAGDAYLVMEMLAEAPAAGFAVSHVTRCAEAEQRLRAEDIDVVLLDLSLPDAHGLDGLARLHAAVPSLPIVIMSGNTDEAMAIAGLRAGAQDYLLKGQADSALVARAVRYAIERQRVEERLAQAQAAELAMRQANRRMEEFLSISGHELRTPLTSVLGNVELAMAWIEELRQSAGAPDDAMRAKLERIATVLQRAERRGTLLDRLVNDLLDTSRFVAGQLELRPARCDLTRLAREEVQECAQRVPGRTVHLETLPQQALEVMADADRLAQVLANYLSNALKYSASDRPVTVGVCIEGAQARLWVHDQGPGLPAAEHARVWERFYRVDGAMHRDGSSVGLGLGLYISKSIVERHGGQVGVESRPGEGATFWFTIPLAAQ